MKYIKFRNYSEQVPIGKIVCIGRNYAAHAKELGNEVPEFPVIFLKAASNVIYSGEAVIHPEYSNNLHHEVELVLYIGETIKNANDQSAEEAIHGYAVGLDMTLRDLQFEFMKKGDPWTLSKSFDTSAVLSNFVLKKDYKLRGDEKISLSVNGTIRQNSSLNNMLFSPSKIVKYVTEKMTLEKGDLIFTGTPEGVGRVVPGDKIFAEIENIGTLETTIVK
ncbi:fumarylacetoacetate hydrolase family protein [Ignavibacteria bacterium 4148-Me]|uniref:fumarylacetoacetate hydrolase family protein n=1 Tax=Rosettibacter primus TaxID=3111523 RepID=UPI00336BEE0B